MLNSSGSCWLNSSIVARSEQSPPDSSWRPFCNNILPFTELMKLSVDSSIGWQWLTGTARLLAPSNCWLSRVLAGTCWMSSSKTCNSLDVVLPVCSTEQPPLSRCLSGSSLLGLPWQQHSSRLLLGPGISPCVMSMVRNLCNQTLTVPQTRLTANPVRQSQRAMINRSPKLSQSYPLKTSLFLWNFSVDIMDAKMDHRLEFEFEPMRREETVMVDGDSYFDLYRATLWACAISAIYSTQNYSEIYSKHLLA